MKRKQYSHRSKASSLTTTATSPPPALAPTWTRIESSTLTLPPDTDGAADDDHPTSRTTHFEQNHYDDDNDNVDDNVDDTDMHQNKKKKKKQHRTAPWTSPRIVTRDLRGAPHEPVGIFLSLEVMDGVTAAARLRRGRNGEEEEEKGEAREGDGEGDSLPRTASNLKKKKKKKTAPSTTATITTTTNEATIASSAPDSSRRTTRKAKQPMTTPASLITTTARTNRDVNESNDTENDQEAAATKETTAHHHHPNSTTDNTTTVHASFPTTKEEPDEALRVLQNTWWKECEYAVQLHPAIGHTLLREQWHAPTPIQSRTLPATILGRHNLVAAAPTGSGKTLCFVLSIFHTLWAQLDQDDDAAAPPRKLPLPLQALIVTPTRELALQIYHVGMKFCIPPSKSSSKSSSSKSSLYSHVSMACITGGLAAAKQIRILQSKHRPPTILVATPGRFWELLNSKLYPHLNDLSQIQFLVIDEADQMIHAQRTFQFPELLQICDAIHDANPMTEEEEAEEENEDDDDNYDDMDRMLGLPGIPGEARVTMMNDAILQQIKEQQQLQVSVNDNDDDDEDEEEDILLADDNNDIDGPNHDDTISLPVSPPVRRQTLVFSATLTLQSHNDDNNNRKPSVTNQNTKQKKKYEKHHDTNKRSNEAWSNVPGAIADLLQKAHAVGRTKVVDLTNGTDSNQHDTGGGTPKAAAGPKANPSSKVLTTKEFQFPPGLQFQQMLCTQRHKDSHLYGYILYFMSLLQQHKRSQSSILIFCNSIAGVRRVGLTLTTLRLPVRMLHANMQQRARFKAVESLQQEDNADGKNQVPTIVVATDVAARGLDIPSVATVIHYDAARTVDTFVHRSGRTARGVGDGAVGCSVSIVASGEDQVHNRIKKLLNVQFQEVPIDGRLLRIAQERVNLACKVATADDTDRKNQRDDQWFIDQAKQAGLEIDDDLLNVTRDDDDSGTRRNRDSNMRTKARQKEAEIARKRLHEMLSQPVQTQRYGKFFRVGSG